MIPSAVRAEKLWFLKTVDVVWNLCSLELHTALCSQYLTGKWLISFQKIKLQWHQTKPFLYSLRRCVAVQYTTLWFILQYAVDQIRWTTDVAEEMVSSDNKVFLNDTEGRGGSSAGQIAEIYSEKTATKKSVGFFRHEWNSWCFWPSSCDKVSFNW